MAKPSMRLLIAEDDPNLGKVLKLLAAQWGFDPVYVTSGSEAFDLCNQPDPPQLMLLDWMMPGMTGIELCRQLRKRRETKFAYLILLTAKGDQKDVVLGLDAGADEYITKPFHVDELKARVLAAQRILERQALLREETATPHAPKELAQETPPAPEDVLALSQDLRKDNLLRPLPRVTWKGRAWPRAGKVLLLNFMAKGGMASVYKGYHTEKLRLVAVKVLFDKFASDMSLLTRFFRECSIAQQVHSPNLVPVLEVGEEEGLFHMVMELVDGMTAEHFLERVITTGMIGLPERQALTICIAATKGLAAAHDAGIVHRDVKPSNILIPRNPDGQLGLERAMLADLGLARHDGEGRLTSTQTAMGTAGYMAPEQARDMREAGKPVDVFAMGATLYDLLSGTPPFTGPSPIEAILKTLNKPHQPIGKLRLDISETTIELVDQCLAKEVNERPADGPALLKALQACLAGLRAKVR